ncbi:hypothetical protein [Agriterribacter sp.]|uniref:hypothetical protein n=1 Tax=Agriterribacter sp. TaxID=2821509 RepID=UPI002D13F1D2|nr:hypothetical protein [Agriterribacter sp.]HRP56264.1 hypothetical protein [Agriterribacter sp.]
MKKAIITVVLVFFTVSAFVQTKEETLQWLRSHLKTIIVHDSDSVLPCTITKTYTFYDDAFVIKTVKDFYKDASLNTAPAFGKIWYRDIFTENDSAVMRGMQKEQKEGKAHVYTIWAEHVYSITGREEAPLPFWRTFNEPMGLDLYLPDSKAFSAEAIHKLYHLASLMGAKEKSPDIIPDENSRED